MTSLPCISKRLWLKSTAAFGLALGAQPPTFAQSSETFSKPVRWVVPTAPGAGTDQAARTFAQMATEAWKQAVVIDNKAGASGMIGLDLVNNAAPDGHTMGFFSVSQFIDATLSQKYAFVAPKDFTPLSYLAFTPLILVMHPGVPHQNLRQLIAAAKANPSSLYYSSGGNGGFTHLAMEVFLNKAGIQVVHVPYKGSGPAVIDLLAGRVQLAFSTPPAVMQHIKSGRLRALAVAVNERTSLAPDIPTFTEAGLGNLSLSSWYGLFGPANVKAESSEKWVQALHSVAATPPWREKILAMGLEPSVTSPLEFTRFLKSERDQWATVASQIGFKRDN